MVISKGKWLFESQMRKNYDEPKYSVTFWGGVGSATGSNFLIEGENTKIMVDCGMLQGLPNSHEFNRGDFPYEPDEIDYLLVTHAHIDHIGRIPKLVKDGFRGKIYSTPETRQIAEVMLVDSAKLVDISSREEGVLPFFTEADVRKTMTLWSSEDYHKDVNLSDKFSFRFRDAGHILGSSIIEIERKGIRTAFTGDLGNSPTPLLRDCEYIDDADYIVMESVYGDRNHESRDERRSKLRKAVLDTVSRRGVLVIPAFSLERTQVLLYELNNLVEEDGTPPLPVFVDSPLAIKITHIYKKNRRNFNVGVQSEIEGGDDIFVFPKLSFTLTVGESKKIQNVSSPKIIIAGSGMSEGGRVVVHEKNYISDPKNIILLTGYQAVGTLGRKLKDGEKRVLIFNEEITVKAEVRTIFGYSSHKDSDSLVEFVEKAGQAGKLKRVFVVMGEPHSSLFLVQRIKDYVGTDAIVPEKGKRYDLV